MEHQWMLWKVVGKNVKYTWFVVQADIYNLFNQETVKNSIFGEYKLPYLLWLETSLHTLLMRNVDPLVITCQVNVPLLSVPGNTANKEFHTMFVFSFIKIKRRPSSYYHTLLPGAFPKYVHWLIQINGTLPYNLALHYLWWRLNTTTQGDNMQVHILATV